MTTTAVTRARRPALVCALLSAVLVLVALAAPSSDAAPRRERVTFPCSRPALEPALAVRQQLTPAATALDADAARKVTAMVRAGAARTEPARAQALGVLAVLGVSGGRVGELQLGKGTTAPAPGEFYRALRQVRGWEALPPTVVVHRVLGTPDPFAFEHLWGEAVTTLAALAGRSRDLVARGVEPGARAGAECVPSAAATAGFPLPAGTDYALVGGRTPTSALLSAPCGTPVLASVSGTARVRAATDGSGPWQVVVEGGDVSVVHDHVGPPKVTDGQLVLVGQELATVGDLGNVASCALGVSLVRGKSAQPRQTTVGWLSSMQAPRGSGAGPGPGRPSPSDQPVVPTVTPATSFRVATFNVLGAHLTAPGQEKARYGPGAERMRASLKRIEDTGSSVVVLNEFEAPQAAALQADGDWQLFQATPNNKFRDGNYSGNGIAWRADTWTLVSSDEFVVPWKVALHMPVVRLRHVDGGAEVVVIGVHNPATTKRQGNQSGARATARAIERQQVSAIREATELPVIIAGDMNERSEVLCDFTRDGLMTTFTDGAASCADYGYGGVDHIFGSGPLTFDDRYVDKAIRGWLSDHPLVTSAVTLAPQTQD